MPIRFSWRPNQAHMISWREWNDAVADATTEDLPMFLCLTASWCRWCQALDEGALSDDVLIATLNRAFVPVRVDVDERPDIALRYSMGGWPTAAFLTPEGETITGATYLTAPELIEMTDNVLEVWKDRREDLAAEVAEIQLATVALLDAMREKPQTREVTTELIDFVAETALSSHDADHGGFGRGAKFPRTDILETLLLMQDHRSRSVLGHTLDSLLTAPIHDLVGGGFYRYSAARDWSSPHTEKLLADNAALATILAQSSVALERPQLAAEAAAIISFLDSTMWLPEANLYRHSLSALDEGEEPKDADDRTYPASNAVAVTALAAVAAATQDTGLQERARHLCDVLWAARSSRGLMTHGTHGPDCYLAPQSYTLEALLALHSEADDGYLARAQELWHAIDRYFSVSGNSVLLADVAAPADVPPDSTDVYRGRVGRLGRTETPLPDNARIAACLARLTKLTGDTGPRDRALAMLEQLAPQATGMGNYSIGLVRAALLAGLGN